MSDPSTKAQENRPWVRVLVAGGRDFPNRDFVFRTLDALAERIRIACIIEGDYGNVDRWAGEWATFKGIANIKFRPGWKQHGRAAGPSDLRESCVSVTRGTRGGHGDHPHHRAAAPS